MLNIVAPIFVVSLYSAQLCWWQLQYGLQHRMVRVPGRCDDQVNARSFLQNLANICQHWKTIEHADPSIYSVNLNATRHSLMSIDSTAVMLNIVAPMSSGTLWKHLLYLCISAQLCWLCWWQLQYGLQHRMVRVPGRCDDQVNARSFLQNLANICQHWKAIEHADP